MKRFWDEARVVQEGGRHAIRLDGRPMRLPGGPLLALEQPALAEAIAAEWQAAGGAKGGTLSALDLPLTRIAGTAQERVAPDPAPTIAALLRYAEADLLCYRAGTPAELAQRQCHSWQPWLDWAAERFGAPLEATHGVLHIPQNPAALAALRTALEAHSPAALAALGIIVPALGSLVLGLAVAHGALEADAAHHLALLDELYQAGKWGEDHEAIARRRAILHDVETAARFLQLSSPATSGSPR